MVPENKRSIARGIKAAYDCADEVAKFKSTLPENVTPFKFVTSLQMPCEKLPSIVLTPPTQNVWGT